MASPDPQRRPWLDTIPEDLLREYTERAWVVRNSTDPLAVLRAVQDWRQHAGVELSRLAVRDARRAGATWQDIGAALGMSRQQAFRTWSKRIEETNSNHA